jgi:hypothetical protein
MLYGSLGSTCILSGVVCGMECRNYCDDGSRRNEISQDFEKLNKSIKEDVPLLNKRLLMKEEEYISYQNGVKTKDQ